MSKILLSVGLVDPFPSRKIPKYLIISLDFRGVIGWLLKVRGVVSGKMLDSVFWLGVIWIRSDLDGLT